MFLWQFLTLPNPQPWRKDCMRITGQTQARTETKYDLTSKDVRQCQRCSQQSGLRSQHFIRPFSGCSSAIDYAQLELIGKTFHNINIKQTWTLNILQSHEVEGAQDRHSSLNGFEMAVRYADMEIQGSTRQRLTCNSQSTPISSTPLPSFPQRADESRSIPGPKMGSVYSHRQEEKNRGKRNLARHVHKRACWTLSKES